VIVVQLMNIIKIIKLMLKQKH